MPISWWLHKQALLAQLCARFIRADRCPLPVRRYTQSADMWAFGIIMLELATGRVPRQGMGFQALVMQTVHGDVPSLADIGTKHSYSKVHLRSLHRDQAAH